MRTALPLAALSLIAGALAGCGVAFGGGDEGNEFFQRMEVSGGFRAGEPMTVLVEIEQFYPVTVSVRCELRTESDLIEVIERDFQVPPLPGGGPDSDPFATSLARDFTAGEPGAYRVECLTPADEDNFIAEEIDVGPPAVAEPTPLGAES